MVSIEASENRDCTVRALMNVCDIPYNSAHSYAKRKGRKDKKGFSAAILFSENNWFAKTNERTKRVIGGRVVYITRKERPKMTVKTFFEQYNVGRYYCTIRGHAFAVIDGNVIGQRPNKCRVDSMYKIEINEKRNISKPITQTQIIETKTEPAKRGKLSFEDADEIRKIAASGLVSRKEIAEKYKIHVSSVSEIITSKLKVRK